MRGGRTRAAQAETLESCAKEKANEDATDAELAWQLHQQLNAEALLRTRSKKAGGESGSDGAASQENSDDSSSMLETKKQNTKKPREVVEQETPAKREEGRGKQGPAVDHVTLGRRSGRGEVSSADVANHSLKTAHKKARKQDVVLFRKVPKLPMVRQGKQWYRARVVKETKEKVFLEFAGYEHKFPSNWLSRDSDRIWMGSYKGKDWRHLGDGAWEPKVAGAASKKPNNGRRGRPAAVRGKKAEGAASSSEDEKDVEEEPFKAIKMKPEQPESNEEQKEHQPAKEDGGAEKPQKETPTPETPVNDQKTADEVDDIKKGRRQRNRRANVALLLESAGDEEDDDDPLGLKANDSDSMGGKAKRIGRRPKRTARRSAVYLEEQYTLEEDKSDMNNNNSSQESPVMAVDAAGSTPAQPLRRRRKPLVASPAPMDVPRLPEVQLRDAHKRWNVEPDEAEALAALAEMSPRAVVNAVPKLHPSDVLKRKAQQHPDAAPRVGRPRKVHAVEGVDRATPLRTRRSSSLYNNRNEYVRYAPVRSHSMDSLKAAQDMFGTLFGALSSAPKRVENTNRRPDDVQKPLHLFNSAWMHHKWLATGGPPAILSVNSKLFSERENHFALHRAKSSPPIPLFC